MHRLIPAGFCGQSRGGAGRPNAAAVFAGAAAAGRRDFTLTGIGYGIGTILNKQERRS
jgi:hypothetical protein